jgi:oligoribonuclease NrnB/cAMP/cGMP phosphodiesterase (DHH superfamily)
MIHLFTHTDLDGVGCAILTKVVFAGHNIAIHYCDYNNVNAQVMDFLTDYAKEMDNGDNEEGEYGCTNLYITDISVNEEVALAVDETLEHYSPFFYVKLIDHHESALWLNKYAWANVSVTDKHRITMDGDEILASGTYLFAELELQNHILSTNKVFINYFANLVRMYDTWDWKNNGDLGKLAKDMNTLFHIIGRDNFINYYLTLLSDSGIDYYNTLLKENKDMTLYKFFDLDSASKQLVYYHDKMIKDYVHTKLNSNTTVITKLPNLPDDLNCLVVFAEQSVSDIAEEAFNVIPSIDLVAVVNIGNQTVSFRTNRDNVNVAEIAAYYGGGGHAKASGCSINPDLTSYLINRLF